jgi:hypothetical protein
VCNIAKAAKSCLQTQCGETKVNSRQAVNPRKMVKLAPTLSKVYSPVEGQKGNEISVLLTFWQRLLKLIALSLRK